MFGSPCSLRSTQCAALIALAAAAGISRFEPDPAKPVIPRPAGATQTPVALASLPRAHIYLAAMQALAPQFRVVRAAFELDRDTTTAQSAQELCADVPAESFPPIAPPVDAPRVRLATLAPALSPGQHSYPYAVGPPWREIDKSLRVAGISVPGGSSTRRSHHSRIAGVFVSAPSAPLTRLTDSGPTLAESVPSPDSALRGEPESPLSHVRRFARPNASTRCGAAFSRS